MSASNTVSYALSPAGEIAYVSVPPAILVIDVAARTVVDTIDIGITPGRIAFSSLGTSAVVVDASVGAHVIR